MVVNILYIGKNNENPSNFEEMFRWWQQVWKENIKPQPNQPILLCLKGGVGQASEASRISGLSFYGNDIKFYEFISTPFFLVSIINKKSSINNIGGWPMNKLILL